MIAVADLIEVYGGGVDAVERTARCSRCKKKGITDMQIIYVGGSNEAMRTSGQANSDYKFKK